MAKSSFVERNKAVREAWNKELELVQEGKGTRKWTPEQQKDILEKGRAYDENGKAFEGQHMKSAEMYPEYQGEPGNIQFLTREEHLEAHYGNWQNPTNWYYNPVTKEKLDFGDGPFIPCEIIQLPEPIISLTHDSTIQEIVIEEKENFSKAEEALKQSTETSRKMYSKSETPKTHKVQIETSKKATLAYNGLSFSVPKRLHIIGMMNTADRSLAMIDYALRRRFSFFDMEPGFDSEGFINYQNSFANETFNTLIEHIKELNKEIAQDKSLGKGFCIGHSYFCNADDCTEEWMKDVVDFDILPMLSEYWFDESSKLQRWENILHGVFQ